MKHRGFTLLELLVVIGIIALLAGMAASMLGSSRASAMKSASLAIMAKTDAALRQFKTEVGAYPWQESYADTGLGEQPGNLLGRRLGGALDRAGMRKLLDDQDEAAARYAYACAPADPGSTSWWVENTAGLSDIAFRKAWVVAGAHGGLPDDDGRRAIAALLNRMAQERVRMAIAAGNVAICGPFIASGQDRSMIRVLGTPRTAARPGWCGDYLHGEIEGRHLRDDAILDAWRRPLAYVCQALPGARAITAQIMGREVRPFDTAWYGLGGWGRTALVRADGTGAATPTDPRYFPDAGELLGSDARYYCAPGQEREFELISAGADGRIDWMRNAPVNRDNVLGGDYLRGLR